MIIKERRTKILLALFLLSDVNFSFVQLLEPIQLVFDLSLNQKTRGTLSALLKEGLIEKNYSNDQEPSVILVSEAHPESGSAKQKLDSGQAQDTEQSRSARVSDQEETSSQYRLTEKGFARLSLKFPFVRFLREKWDGKWRILSYEIPEKKRELRDRLRREVSGWGLGPWHRSFWLTPHPVISSLKELVSQKEEEKYIQAFESEHIFGDRAVLIEKVWGLSQLDKNYRDLFKKWHDTLAKEGNKIEKFKKVIGEYVVLLREDPGLPTELVGEKWIGFEAYNIFKEIRSILLS